MTSLLGIDNFGAMEEVTKVKASFKEFLDWGLVDKGAYVNVGISNSNVFSQTQSRLRAVSDPSYGTTQTWETYRSNLVWESGTSQAAQPIRISGVFVNNVFHAPSSAIYPHYVDYPNGRVVFNSGISSSAQVKMEFSYKSVKVVDSSEFDLLREIQYNSFNTGSTYSPSISGDRSQLRETKIQTPIIALDAIARGTRPYALGSNDKWFVTEIIAHIIGEDKATIDKLESILVFQPGKVFPMLDFDRIASSGAFPLDYRGALNSGALTYPDLSRENMYRDRKAHILDAYNTNDQMISTSLYYKVVRLEVETVKYT